MTSAFNPEERFRSFEDLPEEVQKVMPKLFAATEVIADKLSTSTTLVLYALVEAMPQLTDVFAQMIESGIDEFRKDVLSHVHRHMHQCSNWTHGPDCAGPTGVVDALLDEACACGVMTLIAAASGVELPELDKPCVHKETKND